MNSVGENQTIWKNTIAAFRRQFTQIEKLFVEAKLCATNLADPRHGMNGKEARKLVEPLRHKLELVNNYINSLHTVLPLAAVTEDDGNFSVDKLSTLLDECMERTKMGNQDLTAFLDAIEEWEFIHAKKESKPDGAGAVAGEVWVAPEHRSSRA